MVTLAAAPARAQSCIVECRLEASALSDLAPEWRALGSAARSATVFQTPEWVASWWSVYGGIRRPAVFTVRSAAGDLVALATTMTERSRRVVGRRRLAFMGSWASGQHHVLVAPGWEEIALPALYEAMTAPDQGWSQVVIVEMPSPWPSLLALSARPGHPAPERENESPVIALPGDWEGYLAALPRKERHELRRKLRRAAEAGMTRRVTTGGPNVARDLDVLFALNRRRWGRQGLWAPGRLAYARKRRFLARATAALAAAGAVHIHVSSIGSRDIAAVLCYDDAETSHAYLVGYDAAFATLSPGLVTFAAAIDTAIARGRRRFNFICGQHDYKYRLGASDEPLWGWTVECG